MKSFLQRSGPPSGSKAALLRAGASPGSRMNGSRAMNASTRERLEWKDEYLKFGFYVASLDENYQKIFPGKPPLTVKSFEKEASQTLMVHIVTSIVSVFDIKVAEKLNNKRKKLKAFETLGLGSVSHDATIEILWQTARRYFTEDNVIFLDMGILRFPEHDIPRAKFVIAHLAGYLQLSDTVHESFEAEWNRLKEEGQAKVQLYQEIEDLRNALHKEVTELQARREQLPQLEEELKLKETERLEKRNKLAALEQEMLSAKNVYDRYASEVRQLEAQLQGIQNEKLRLEAQIVDSPDCIQARYKTEKALLEDEEKKRNTLGQKLNQLGESVTVKQKLIEKCQKTVNRFNNIIGLMEKARQLVRQKEDNVSVNEKIQNEIDETSGAVHKLEAELERLGHEENYLKDFWGKTAGKLKEKIEQSARESETAQFKLDEVDAKLNELEGLHEEATHINLACLRQLDADIESYNECHFWALKYLNESQESIISEVLHFIREVNAYIAGSRVTQNNRQQARGRNRQVRRR